MHGPWQTCTASKMPSAWQTCFRGGEGGVWVLVRDACMQNLTLPQCHWWSLSCSLLCFWGWILMPPMGRGMLQMRSHFSFTRVGAHELPTLSTGGALHGGRRQLDRYDLVSRSGAAHKRQMQLPCAKHQHVHPLCQWTQEHPPPSLDSRQREDANSKWNPRMPPALPELLTALLGQNLQSCVRPSRPD